MSNHVKWHRMDTLSYISRCKMVHGDNFDYARVNYVNATTKIVLTCNKCSLQWEVNPWNHLRGRGCPKCAIARNPKNQTKTHEWFINKAHKIHGNAFTYIGTFRGTKMPIEMRCNKCGATFSQRASSHLDGCGCDRCAANGGRRQNSPADINYFIKKATTVHGDSYDYSSVNYRGHKHRVTIMCRRCGKKFDQWPVAHFRGSGCPICRESKGERAIAKFLTNRGVRFERQKTFDGCVSPKSGWKLFFDFYLPAMRTCIEFDGEQHFSPMNFYRKSPEQFADIRLRDKAKNDYCSKHGIRMIRIGFRDMKKIRDVLQSELMAEAR